MTADPKPAEARPSIARTPLRTVPEVADYLRIDAKTVRLMASRGELRGSMVAHQWRFEDSAVDEYVAERENVISPRRRRRRAS